MFHVKHHQPQDTAHTMPDISQVAINATYFAMLVLASIGLAACAGLCTLMLLIGAWEPVARSFAALQ